MTETEIVNETFLETGMDRKEALHIVEEFIDSLKRRLANDKNVYLKGSATSF